MATAAVRLGWTLYFQLGETPNQVIYGYVPNKKIK